MPFGMAGLDFCVRNPYRNREKTFFAEGAYRKKVYASGSLLHRSGYKTRTIRLGRFVFMYEEVGAKRT